MRPHEPELPYLSNSSDAAAEGSKGFLIGRICNGELPYLHAPDSQSLLARQNSGHTGNGYIPVDTVLIVRDEDCHPFSVVQLVQFDNGPAGSTRACEKVEDYGAVSERGTKCSMRAGGFGFLNLPPGKSPLKALVP